jgi:hypothetical protein
VRKEQNIGLKEAKDAVDEYVRTQPGLQASLSMVQSEAKRSALLWLLAIIVVALVIYRFAPSP